jgi:hypothetical protein
LFRRTLTSHHPPTKESNTHTEDSLLSDCIQLFIWIERKVENMKINFEKAVSYIDTLYENDEVSKKNILKRQNSKNSEQL